MNGALHTNGVNGAAAHLETAALVPREPTPEPIDLRDVARDHASAIRARVLRAIEHHAGTLEDLVVIVTSSVDYVLSLTDFVAYAARAGKVDATKFRAQLVASLRLDEGDRVCVAAPKPTGEGWTFGAVIVPRVDLSGLGT